MHTEWIAQQIGILQTMVIENRRAGAEALQTVRWELGQVRREMLEHIRRLDRKPRSNGHGPKLPWGQIAVMLALVILSILGHVSPQAVKGAVTQMLLRQVGAG